MTELAEITDKKWDAVVIGTGMGGATLGYALAQAGWNVLFCEKGKSSLTGTQASRGAYAETYFTRPATAQTKHHEILRQAGRYFEEVQDLSYSKPRRFIPFIGSGTGGSSALYGMALERFFPADFTPRRHYPNAGDSTLPDSWPIAYSDLAPYYEIAEALYGVRGGADPLKEIQQLNHREAAPPFTPAAQELADFFLRKGLHPYRLPLACAQLLDCRGCQGYLCARNCKNDSGRICLLPALNNYHAKLLDECEVLKLETHDSVVTHVVCRWRGSELRISGRSIILAAGALATPALLFKSASPEWPEGLANESGWVGKNLMRHYVDLYAVFSKLKQPISANQKEWGCNDFYLTGGEKLGSVQSFGVMPPAATIVESMQQDLRDGTGKWAGVAFGLIKPLIRPAISRLFSRTLVFASVMEDLPYLDNHISLDANAGLAIRYLISEHEATRISTFRRRLKAAFSPYQFLLLKQAENNQRLAHVCGTCRFGLNPRNSVLDANNKAHGLANLYVVDGSFFPSSGGTNPALTIAANALRVAAHLTGNAASKMCQTVQQ